MTKKEVAIVPSELSAQSLSQVMQGEAEKRKLIVSYISKHMVSGTDYGTIKIGGRDSKPSLFKPGSEKFLSLFKLTAKFEKDTETWEMAGSETGVFAYKCNLIASNGQIVGEGRGISKLSEKQSWTINNAVKIAEKRAQIDAVLRTGALSDFFTQDLEDMQQTYDTSPISNKAVPVVYTDEEEVPDDETEQRKIIVSFVKQLSPKINWKDAKEVGQFVADETQLALVPKNFKFIIKTLEKRIKSK